MKEFEDISNEKIKEFFEDRLPESITKGEVIDILFLVLDEKPGVLVMGADKETEKVLDEFCNEFDIEMKVVEGQERSLLDRILGRDTRFMKDTIFLAQNQERFEILEESEGRFCGFTDRAVGKFLGYPDSAVEYYGEKAKEEPAGMEVEEKIDELIQEDKINDDAKRYLEMISYLPAPNKEDIRDAVEEGRKRKEVLEENLGRCEVNFEELWRN